MFIKKFCEVKTPLVLKINDEKTEIKLPNKRFIEIATMNFFARNFSAKNEKTRTKIEQVKTEKRIPKKIEFVFTQKVKVQNAEKEINPSKKSAREPVHSLKSAPVPAKRSGQEEKIKSKINIFFPRIRKCNYKKNDCLN